MAVASSLPSYISRVIQENYLQRRFIEALKPRTLFRAEAVREQLAIEAGQAITMTRRGLIQPAIDDLTPGADPGTIDYSIEQWTVEIRQAAKSKETHLPSSAVAIVNKFIEDAVSLAEHAGWSVDRKARNAIFTPYESGDTWTTAATGGASTTISVSAINGFTQVTDSDGKPRDVSSTYKLAVTVDGVSNNVIGATPAEPNWPNGPGVLTLEVAVNLAAARKRVIATNRPYRSLPTGVANIDAITAASYMSFGQLLASRNRMQKDRVPVFEDGTYHVHLDPDHLKQLLEDASFRQLYQGQPNSEEYRAGRLIRQLGLTFFDNTDLPAAENLSLGLTANTASFGNAIAAKEIGAEIANVNGIPLRRSLMLGKRSLHEMWIPEERYREQMGGVIPAHGYQGAFIEGNGGFEADLAGIRYVVRPPQDPLLQKVMQSWSISAGWVAPSDERSTTSAARYKRAVVMLSA